MRLSSPTAIPPRSLSCVGFSLIVTHPHGDLPGEGLGAGGDAEPPLPLPSPLPFPTDGKLGGFVVEPPPHATNANETAAMTRIRARRAIARASVRNPPR